MLSTIRKVCAIPKEKFYIGLEYTGNTVSSTLPVALRDAMDKTFVSVGDQVLLAGFGVRYSYGTCTIKF